MNKLFRKNVLYGITAIIVMVFTFVMFFANSPKVEAASTSVIDSLTIKNIYDNRTTGKYGNFSWAPEKIIESTDSYFVMNRNEDPFFVIYTPTSGSIPEKYTFSIDAGEDNYTANIAVARSENGLSFNYGGAGTRNLSNKTVPSSTKETDPIYFGISQGYMFTNIKISSFTLNLMVTKVAVKGTAGTGVKSVFFSTSSVATSGSASGTEFDKGKTVYGYAVLKEGYKAQNSWTLIDGTPNSENSIYRIGSTTVGTSDYNFGTINAELKTKYIIFDKNGGGNSTSQQITYGQSATLSPISRNGYTFTGWNSKQDGTGTAYGDGNGATLTVEQVNEMVLASSNTTLYAQWSVNTYTIIFDEDGGTGGPDPIELKYGDPFPVLTELPTREGYEFGGYRYTEPQYSTVKTIYNADGTVYLNPNESYIYEDNAHLDPIWKGLPYPVTISAGTGVNSVFLNESFNQTSGSPSGTEFTNGRIIYGYIVLERGYVAPGSWSRVTAGPEPDVGGAIYYIGGTVDLGYDFGAVNAILGQYPVNITRGTGLKNVKVSANADGTNLVNSGSKFYYNSQVYAYATLAKGYKAPSTWTLISGTANTEDALYLIDTIENIDITNDFGTVNATPKTYPVTLDGLTDPIIVTFDADMPKLTVLPVKEGFTFVGYWNEDGTSQYYDENGESTHKWDLDGTDLTLVAHWTKDMTVTSSGYEAGYDGSAHGITITVTDPENYTIYYESTTDNYNLTEAPTYTNTGEYTVKFKIVEAEYTDYYGSETVVIKEVDKEELKTLINNCDNYYNSIKDNYSSIADDFNNAINDAKLIRDNVNVTSEVVSNTITTLTTALNTAKADVTKAKITAIGTVAYTDECKALIDDARGYYDNLDNDTQKDLVSNYQALLDAEVLYNAVDSVVAKVNAISGVSNYQAYTEALADAKTAYSALTDAQKAIFPADVLKTLNDNDTIAPVVDEINAIGDSEDTEAFRNKVNTANGHYGELTTDLQNAIPDFISKILNDDLAAISAMDKINAIGDVEYTSACKALIDAANTEYDGLTEDQKALVVNYDKLVEANTDYNNVDESVIAIKAIGDVEYTSACKALIDTARETYDALTDEQKEIQPQMFLNVLVDAEKAYTAMDKINAIATPEFTDEYKDALLDARNYYDNLSDKQMDMVLNYQDLINAENAFTAMTYINAIKDADNITDYDTATTIAHAAYTTLSADQLALIPEEFHNLLADALVAKDAIGKIDAIGDVSHTDACKALIDAANVSYAALTDAQKALVQGVNYTELVKANLDYDNVDESINKINNIGEFEFTDECKAKIDEARTIYDELTDDQKAILPDDILKTLEDDEHAYNAMNLIKNIGEVKNNDESRALVKAAREYLDDLTNDQLDLVDPAFIKILEDDEAALSTMDKINNIGKVEYTKDCKAKIDAARTSYDGLTDDQKAIVNANNYRVLTDAEKAYADTDNAHKKIDDIGSVKRTDECKASIDRARATYDALTVEEKAIMPAEKYNALVNAEKAYGALVEIYNIGDVSYDSESDDKIKAARAAYDSLTDDQKKLIDNNDLKVLTDKEADFSSTDKAATIWGVILLILSIIALGVGCYFLYLVTRKNNKNNTVKASSSVLPLTILTSYFAIGSYLAFYIVFSCALAVWAAVLVIYLLKKKGVIMASTASGAVAMENVAIQENNNANNYIPVEAATSDTENEESLDDESSEEAVETTRDASGNIFKIQYISSFTAKLIQSSDETKRQYSELRKEVLSYSGTKSKTTWHYDTISYGRTVILRFGIRGKTLCVYYALNYEDFENTKYKLENVTSKKHSSAPCLYRIKNDRRFNYAKELIEIIAKKYDLIKEEKEIEDIMPPYEDRDTLVSKGLIKKLEVKLTSNNKNLTEVTADEANEFMSNEAALGCIIKDNDSKIHEGKKEIVNLRVLEEQYNDGDTVNIESLIEKGIINSNVGYVKLLAGGKLDKKLNVELQDYSIEAVKMIVILGGTVKKVR